MQFYIAWVALWSKSPCLWSLNINGQSLHRICKFTKEWSDVLQFKNSRVHTRWRKWHFHCLHELQAKLWQLICQKISKIKSTLIQSNILYYFGIATGVGLYPQPATMKINMNYLMVRTTNKDSWFCYSVVVFPTVCRGMCGSERQGRMGLGHTVTTALKLSCYFVLFRHMIKEWPKYLVQHENTIFRLTFHLRCAHQVPECSGFFNGQTCDWSCAGKLHKYKCYFSIQWMVLSKWS